MVSMRAERLLSIVMLLKSKGRMTAGELAAELEVSERTVLRDIDALSLSGIPVYSERGRAGGFALVPGYRTDLSGLTLGEAIALLSGDGRLDSPAAVRAKQKLEASLPDVHRGQVAAASQRILVRPEGFVRAPQDLDALEPLQQAVFEGRRVRMTYRAREREPRERVVDPIGLIVAGDTWYLVAHPVESGDSRDERMYRVSRMRDVTVLDVAAQRDPLVDLAAIWDRSRSRFRAQFEPFDVEVRCAREDLQKFAKFAKVSEPADRESSEIVTTTMTFVDREHAAKALWVACLHADIDVVEPEWLRESIFARAQSVAQRLSGH